MDDIFTKIQTRLISEENLSVAYAAILAAQAINGFQPELKEAVEKWADGKSVAKAGLGEYTVADIQDEIGCSEFQALCVLSLASRYPDCFANAVLFLPTDEVETLEADDVSPEMQKLRDLLKNEPGEAE